jgi:hypothetical protein
VEGPVHRETITRRVTQLWGVQRAGNRIRQAVEHALQVVSQDAKIRSDGVFYAPAGLVDVTPRDRSSVDCATVRRPEMIPPAEVRRALHDIAKLHLGVGQEEAVTETARLMGFRATGSQLRQVIEEQLDWLLKRGWLQKRNDTLYAADVTSAHQVRP